MTTLTKEIVIPKDRRIRLDFEAPPECPEGMATITLVFTPERKPDKRPKSGIAALCGKGKGKFTMSPDFNAPLDDFKEYME